jgi:hypothetical protein
MKRIATICIIGLFLSPVAAAQHSEGWGLGVMFHGGPYWDNYLDNGSGGFAISLKAPALPIHWGVNLDFIGHHFGTGITADYYFIDKIFDTELNLGWYMGVGGTSGFEFWDNNLTRYTLGIRVPAGLSWQFMENTELFDRLELVLSMAPSVGLGFGDGGKRFSGGWFAEVGLRIWLNK